MRGSRARSLLSRDRKSHLKKYSEGGHARLPSSGSSRQWARWRLKVRPPRKKHFDSCSKRAQTTFYAARGNAYQGRMMADETHLAGATPGDDTSGLMDLSLVTRADRNTAEAQTIGLAYNQYIFEARRKKRGTTWLTDDFILAVHRSMFGSIWTWGGQYRKERLNMGCEPHLIREQLKLLSDDFLAWDSTESHMPVIEVAARLQNRLTKIHPFRNGNGRHARLVTDIFLHSRKHPLTSVASDSPHGSRRRGSSTIYWSDEEGGPGRFLWFDRVYGKLFSLTLLKIHSL